MTYFKHCPIPVAGGGDCWEEPHPASGFGLCVSHWRGVVDQWFDDQPTVTIRCLRCDRLNHVDSADLPTARCDHCTMILDDQEFAELMVAEERRTSEQETHRKGVVYYIRFGGRVKIGFTTSLRTRVMALPCDEVLAAEPGWYDLEGARHAMFGHLKVESMREWFEAAPELLTHAEAVRAKYGDPFAVAGGGEDD